MPSSSGNFPVNPNPQLGAVRRIHSAPPELVNSNARAQQVLPRSRSETLTLTEIDAVAKKQRMKIEKLINTKVGCGESAVHIQEILNKIASSYLSQAEKRDLSLKCVTNFSPKSFIKKSEVRVYKALLESIDSIRNSRLTPQSIIQPKKAMQFETLLDEIVARTQTSGLQQQVIKVLLREKIEGALYMETVLETGQKDVYKAFAITMPTPFLSGFFQGPSPNAWPTVDDIKAAAKYFKSQNLLLEMYEKKALPPGYALYVLDGSKEGDPVNFIAAREDSVPQGYRQPRMFEVDDFKQCYQNYQKYLTNIMRGEK